MKPLVINPSCADKVVAHNNIGKKVGAHTQTELKLLAIEARKSNNPILLGCFSGELPSLEELTSDKVDAQLAKVETPPADDTKKK